MGPLPPPVSVTRVWMSKRRERSDHHHAMTGHTPVGTMLA